MTAIIDEIETLAEKLDTEHLKLLEQANTHPQAFEKSNHNTEITRKKAVKLLREVYAFAEKTDQKKYCDDALQICAQVLKQRKGNLVYANHSNVIHHTTHLIEQTCAKYINDKNTAKISEENLEEFRQHNNISEKTLDIAFKHPYLFQGTHIDGLLNTDKDAMKKFRRHFEFFRQISYEEIAAKQFDKQKLEEMLDRYYHNNFHMALNTLIKLHEHPSTQTLFPLNAAGTHGNTELPSQGMIFELPLQTIQRLHSFDKFIYLYDNTTTILHDCIGYYLMKGDNKGLEEFCDIVEQEKITGLKKIAAQLIKKQVQEIFPTRLTPHIITADEMYEHKEKFDEDTLAREIKKMAKENNFRIQQTDAETAAQNTQITNMLVFTTASLKGKKLDYYATETATRNLYVIANPDGSYTTLTPDDVDKLITEKTDKLLTEIPRAWQNGKHFYHEHKQEFEAHKQGELTLSDKISLLAKMQELPKEYATQVTAVTRTKDLQGKHAFVSQQNPEAIVAKEIDDFTKEMLFLGYATGNCLKWFDLFDIMMEEKSHTKLLWHKGIITGAAFEISLGNGGYLLDSIEFNTEIKKHAPKQYTQKEYIKGVVHAYLDALHDNHEQLYAMPESNSLFVEQAIKNWLEEKNARERLISYSKTPQIPTDTAFKKMPYAIPKKQ
ncbi:hypothetical protein HY485_02980 [Candidatus Woesearchaeota archaeon]|nr:hypothetical protein [Candidatus Woesearchaeota archaeon]